MKNQAPLTTVHLLISGALLTASIGATVGVLLGLEHAIGRFLPLGEDRVGAHAAMMDTYLFLVASSIIEWALRPAATRWGWGGLAQAVLWAVGATLVPIAFFLNIVPTILPIFGMMLIVGMIIFLVRFGWRALVNLPRGAGVKSWAFFSTLWLIVYMGLFLWIVSTGGNFAALPPWFGAVFAHAGFVGMMTNAIFAVMTSRGQAATGVLPWGEPAALWLINIGLVAFAAGKIAADIRHGAWVMGLAVVLGVVVMALRIRRS
jgi:hypothetical protein